MRNINILRSYYVTSRIRVRIRKYVIFYSTTLYILILLYEYILSSNLLLYGDRLTLFLLSKEYLTNLSYFVTLNSLY